LSLITIKKNCHAELVSASHMLSKSCDNFSDGMPIRRLTDGMTTTLPALLTLSTVNNYLISFISK